MSDYQYYEFQSIDQSLNESDQKALRSLSTRAEITATSFVNEYNWGDFRGNPNKLMEKYFDAFFYLANWGTHRLMFRFPLRIFNEKIASLYCRGGAASFWTTKEHIILEFLSDPEEADDWEVEEGQLTSLLQVRADLIQGDLRALYLGWLLCAQTGEFGNGEMEPPVPPGLAQLTGSLRSFAEFLRIDWKSTLLKKRMKKI